MKCEHCEIDISKHIQLKQNTGGLYNIIKNVSVEMPYTCKYCGGSFCGEHRLPENHNCIGLEVWKAKRWKQVLRR